jgi:hypothetical protein
VPRSNAALNAINLRVQVIAWYASIVPHVGY